ncbi:MAG: hypothetical protein HN379_06755 [Desulfobacteraceae bacterium]|nr:hypothetical protein [Desulfobacteraceae bacterium]MBT4365671.1 hypothetical protein [Desulfobacteraceae bacterium]
MSLIFNGIEFEERLIEKQTSKVKKTNRYIKNSVKIKKKDIIGYIIAGIIFGLNLWALYHA